MFPPRKPPVYTKQRRDGENKSRCSKNPNVSLAITTGTAESGEADTNGRVTPKHLTSPHERGQTWKSRGDETRRSPVARGSASRRAERAREGVRVGQVASRNVLLIGQMNETVEEMLLL